MKTLIVVLAGAVLLAGCAKNPDRVSANYVGPLTYANLSCPQLISERNRIVTKVNELSGIQRKEATEDAVATGVALVLFWPAAFFLADGGDASPQLATMKGHYDAVSQAYIEKSC